MASFRGVLTIQEGGLLGTLIREFANITSGILGALGTTKVGTAMENTFKILQPLIAQPLPIAIVDTNTAKNNLANIYPNAPDSAVLVPLVLPPDIVEKCKNGLIFHFLNHSSSFVLYHPSSIVDIKSGPCICAPNAEDQYFEFGIPFYTGKMPVLTLQDKQDKSLHTLTVNMEYANEGSSGMQHIVFYSRRGL